VSGISNYAEEKLLNTLRNVSFAVAQPYIKLHLGDPGENGTSDPAANTERQQVTFTAASNGSMTSSATVTWSSVPNAETYTHWSLWDHPTAGECLWRGQLSTPGVMLAGDTFQITALTLTLD
jgi:hypothetical protein